MLREEFVQDVARGAGKIIMERYQTTREWHAKTDPGDIVTEVDIASEKYVIDRIRAEFPSDDIVSEEIGAVGEGGAEYVWIIDPIDGTKNYMMNIPFFCVSIGVVRNGVPEVGVIFDPVRNEMFFATRGGGAFLNGSPISVSPAKTIEDGLVNVSWVKGRTNRDQYLEYMKELSKRTSYFRRMGSAALVMAYIACGRMHGYLQGGLSPWDVAAGLVIVSEAGGVVTDFEGNPIDLHNKAIELVTANPDIHRELLVEVITAHRC